MLKELILTYGKERVNSLTKYPSILTLHALGERGKLTDTLTIESAGEPFFATEKIDGTNVRLLLLGGELVIGSREFLLSHSGDLFFDPAQGIVDGIAALEIELPAPSTLTVLYGELYGGRVSANSKQYGTSKVGFRLFDVVEFAPGQVEGLLAKSQAEISRWRETEEGVGLRYGQPFLSHDTARARFGQFNFVPLVDLTLGDLSHRAVLDGLRQSLPGTKVALTDDALGRAEGVVIRNASRTKIAKIRFEDYERTLR